MTTLALGRKPQSMKLLRALCLLALLGAMSTTVYSCSDGPRRSYDGGMSGEDGGDRG